MIVCIMIQYSSPFFCLALWPFFSTPRTAAAPPLLLHDQLPAAAQLSNLADTVQSFMCTRTMPQECQADTLDLILNGGSRVCLLNGHGIAFIIYLYQWGKPHWLEQMQSTWGKQYQKPQPIQELLFWFQCRKIHNLVLLEAFTSPQKRGNIPF